MLRPEIRYTFRKERPTNFKLGTQMEYEDLYHRQSPLPPRSKVKVARSRDVSDRCWPISRERNVLATPIFVGWLPTQRAVIRTRFKVKGQRSRLPGRRILRPDAKPKYKPYCACERLRPPTTPRHVPPRRRLYRWLDLDDFGSRQVACALSS